MFRKLIFIYLFLAISPNIFAQIADADFFTLEREMCGVKKITERHSPRPTGHWKSVFFYDENGFLLRQVSYHKRRRWHFFKARADYRYEYSISDTLLIIKQREVRNINNNPPNYIKKKYYYNHLKQCYRFEIYSSNFSLISNGKPFVVGDNFIYKDDLLQSFDRHIFFWRNDSLELGGSDRHTFTHDSKRRTEQIYRNIHTGTAFMCYCITTTVYQNGKLTDIIRDCDGSGGVFMGVYFWSKDRPDKMHIRFSNFDRHGNWTRSYFVTEKGKRLRSERRIRYW